MNQIAYLECRDGIHNKFYLMTMTDPCGANFTIRWGRIGTEGSSCLQPISNWDKKLHERLSHGYVDRTQDYLDGKINGPAAWTEVGGAKYKMSGTRKTYKGHELYMIVANKTFETVEGSVCEDAVVRGEASIKSKAICMGHSLICDSAIVNGIVRGYATVAEKANVKEGTLVEGDTYYIQS